MRLDRLIIENYRQYSERSEIEFAPPGPRNVTLIRGLNGAGKTHLLEALHWCLYGGADNEGLRDMVSKGTLAKSSEGDVFDLAVELLFDHDGRKYRSRRKVRVSVHAPIPDQGPSFSVQAESFDVFEIEPDGNAREVAAPRDEIYAILPKDASAYFFFDGEKIDKFAKPDNAVGIRNAVDAVLKFAYLDRAIAHVKDVRQEVESDLRRLAAGTEIEPLLVDKREREDQKTQLETELGAVAPELEQIELQKVAVDNALLETQAQRDKLVKRQELRGELSTANEQSKAEVERLASLIPSSFLAFAGAALAATLEEANAKRKKGEIPGKIRQVVVRDLLEEGVCICGRALDVGSQAHEIVAQLGTRASSSRLEERVIAAATTLPGLVRRSSAETERLAESLRRQRTIAKMMKITQEKLTELDEELRDSRQEEIRDLIDKSHRLEREYQRLIMRRQDVMREVAELTRLLSGLDTQIEKARRQSTQVDSIRRRAVLAREAENALVATRERFAAEVRQQVEAGTSEMFKHLVWKESHFDRVVIGDDFGLSVIDRWGQSALGDLSAGETEVLSLSFIVTMGRVAGEAIESSSAPVVIDSPFGRLSAEPREKIAASLPAIVDQLVLLVTDTELQGTEAAIRPKVGRRYDLVFDPDTSCTMPQEVSVNG